MHKGVQSSIRNVYQEEELKEYREKMEALLNLLPDPVVIVDQKGKFLAVNDRVEEKTGFKKEELFGKNFIRTKIVTRKSKAILIKNLAKRMMGMHVAPYEVEALTKDGEKLAVEINASKIEYAGNPADMVILRDISERKRVEREIRIRDNAITSSINAIAFADLEGNLTYVNPAFLKLWGYENDEEVLGKPCVGFWQSEEKASEVIEVLRNGKGWIGDLIAMKKDGSPFHVHLSANIVKEDGEPICMMASFVDITERKRAEEKLRQYSEHLEELIQKRTEQLLELDKKPSAVTEEAGNGIVILQDEKIVFANKKLQEIIGYPMGELIGMPFEKLVHEKHRQQAKQIYVRRMRGEKVPASNEIGLVAKTGEYVPIEVNTILMNFLGAPAEIVSLRDIREKKRMEEEHSKLDKLRRHLELEKSRKRKAI